MRKKYIVFLFTILFFQVLKAQPDQNTELAKNYKLDFVTPDQPAFNILGTTPSNLLRPSNAKEFSSITSEWFKGTPYIIPESFGIEISPYLLTSSQSATLSDYQNNRTFASWRLSFGTGKDENTTKRNVAIGMRITPIDNGDMRTDAAYLNNLTNIANNIAAERADLRDNYLRDHNMTMADYAKEAINKEVDNWVTQQMNTPTGHSVDYDSKIEQAREEYKRDNWNASKLDLALAVLLNSPDSLLKNVYYKKSSFWLTGSIKPGAQNRNSQILVGINIFHEQKLKEALDTMEFNKINFSIPARVYLGSNKYKGFAEFQYSFQTFLYPGTWSLQSNTLLSFGTEINIKDGIWLLINGGWNNEFTHNSGSNESTRKSNFSYGIDFRFNIPEKFKLF
jgi:hypothetical protein